MKNQTQPSLIEIAEIDYRQDIEAEYREQQRREDAEAMQEYNDEAHY